MTYWLLCRNYPYVSQLLSSWSMQSLPGRKQVCVTSATVANWSLCSKYLHVSQPFFKMIYAVCSTAADWLPLSLPENIQLWPSLSETASELWVNWTWWSRHHGNLTGIAVCIAEMDLLLLIGIIFIMIYFTQLLRKLSVYAFDSIQYCISVCSVQLILGSIGWNGKRGRDIMTTAQKNSLNFDDLAIALMDVVLIEIIYLFWNLSSFTHFSQQSHRVREQPADTRCPQL